MDEPAVPAKQTTQALAPVAALPAPPTPVDPAQWLRMGVGAEGAAGAAGGASDPAGEVDECWMAEPGSDCSTSFSGVVRSSGRDVGAEACDASVFGGLTALPSSGRSRVEVTDGVVTLRVVLGRSEAEVSVTVDDEVDVAQERRNDHAERMSGSRLIISREDQLVALWAALSCTARCGKPDRFESCLHRIQRR